MRTVSLLLILLPLWAEAAPRVNNGGGVWKCVRENRVAWIQAADFFEPKPALRSRQNFGRANTAEIFRSQSELVSRQIPELAKLLKKWPVDFEQVTRYVPFPLNSTDDMNFSSRPQPEDCAGGVVSYEQVAVYLYDDTLLISEPVWKTMEPTDQAAILFHEWIYKALRGDRDEQNSSRTRRIVAWLFSGKEPVEIAKSIKRELLFSSHDQLEDELATFPVSPRCEAFVDKTIVGSWQPLGREFGEGTEFTGLGFRFRVETSARDGVPGAMTVTDESSGWQVSLEAPIARATYLRLKRTELRFRRGGSRPTDVFFWCWNQI